MFYGFLVLQTSYFLASNTGNLKTKPNVWSIIRRRQVSDQIHGFLIVPVSEPQRQDALELSKSSFDGCNIKHQLSRFLHVKIGDGKYFGVEMQQISRLCPS